jgi:hypothetical protein
MPDIRGETTMEEIGYRIRACGTLLSALVLLGAAGILPGCATTRPAADPGRTVWHHGDQYVRIEQKDSGGGDTETGNSHPADISAGRLRSMLESIDVRPSGGGRAAPLFGDDELGILSEHLHAGLASAGPGEDVTFAIIGHHAVLAGLLKERMITLGRVFCRGKELNIIFGDVLREVNEREDRRLYPFQQGLRTRVVPREFDLTMKPGKEKFIMKRPDWVIFPVAGPVLMETAPTTPKGENAAAQDRALPVGNAGKKQAGAGQRSIEERLTILNDLKNRKLITDEEYRAKRREILDEI